MKNTEVEQVRVVRINPDLHKRLRILAARLDKTIQWVTETALLSGLEDMES